MKTLTLRKSALTLLTSLALAASASATVIGPWPTNTTYMWEDSPLPTVTQNGTNFIVTELGGTVLSNGQYWFPVPTTTPKNDNWLPYNLVDSAWAERQAVGQHVLEPGTALGSLHIKVFDGAAGAGRHGWTVTLRDNAGRILDFGIRGYFASAQIKDRQFDGGTNWIIPTGFIERDRTGNDYYTTDFTQNPGGTIHWEVEKLVSDGVGGFTPYYFSGDTTVAYGDISVIELGASTSNTTGLGTTYKWTEFSYALAFKLSIALQDPDVVLSWSTNQPPAVLEQAAALTGGWSDVTNSLVASGTMWTVTLPQDSAGQFFRLRQQ